jgi:hypothetical protein
MRVRTRDRNARLLVVADVDDGERRFTRAAFEIDAGESGSVSPPETGRRICFRMDTKRAAQMPFLRCGASLPPDGNWHDIVIGEDAGGAANARFKPRHWHFARLIGDIDIASAGIAAPTPGARPAPSAAR